MGEYAAAKAAGEAACRHLAIVDRHVTVRIDRLPRLVTDQTASVQRVAAADTVDVMVDVLMGSTYIRINAQTGMPLHTLLDFRGFTTHRGR